MQRLVRPFIFLLPLLIINLWSAVRSANGPGFHKDGFGFEAILSVDACDLDGDGCDELLVTGRNYLEGGAYVEIYSWTGESFQLVWKSPNLIESESSLSAEPVSLPGGPAVIALTRTSFYVFHRSGDGFVQGEKGSLSLAPEETARGDLDGDGTDELIVATTVENTKSGRKKNLHALFWRDGSLVDEAASPPLGNIRALAAGDLDGDGRAEIIADVGITTGPGEFHLLKLQGSSLQETGKISKPMPQAAYGLTVGGGFPEPGCFLLAASQPGKFRSFCLTSSGLAAYGQDLSYHSSPVSLAVGDLDGDGRSDVISAGYPAVLDVFWAFDPARP